MTKGTYAKMARGEMVRFMAENRIENPEDIKKFDRLGYSILFSAMNLTTVSYTHLDVYKRQIQFYLII